MLNILSTPIAFFNSSILSRLQGISNRMEIYINKYCPTQRNHSGERIPIRDKLLYIVRHLLTNYIHDKRRSSSTFAVIAVKKSCLL